MFDLWVLLEIGLLGVDIRQQPLHLLQSVLHLLLELLLFLELLVFHVLNHCFHLRTLQLLLCFVLSIGLQLQVFQLLNDVLLPPFQATFDELHALCRELQTLHPGN